MRTGKSFIILIDLEMRKLHLYIYVQNNLESTAIKEEIIPWFSEGKILI